MLPRNIDRFRGHVNGALLIKMAVCNVLVTLETLTCVNLSKSFAIQKIPCPPRDSNFLIRLSTRRQSPLTACFAIAMNKGQGRSFCGAVVLDPSNAVFSHRQVFVGTSKEKHYDRLKTFLPLKPDSQTKDVVYSEAVIYTSIRSPYSYTSYSLLQKFVHC